MLSILFSALSRFFLGLAVSAFSLASASQAQTLRSAPDIEFYKASNETIHTVQAVRLSWKIHNAVKVDVYDGFRNTTYENLGQENYIEVWPEKTSKYILYAYGANGETATSELTIMVDYYPVLIDFFDAAPRVTDPRQPVKLWWKVRNARIVDVLDVTKNTTYPNLGNENYIFVYPEKTSNYALYARGDGNQTQRLELTVFVRQFQPTIDFFHASTYVTQANEPVMLKWKVSQAIRAEIFDGSKNVTYPVGLQGEILVYPEKNAAFYLYAYDEAGQVATRELFIKVHPGPH